MSNVTMTPETILHKAQRIQNLTINCDAEGREYLNVSAYDIADVADAYIVQSDTLLMNQGQIEYLRKRVTEMAKVQNELVDVLIEARGLWKHFIIYGSPQSKSLGNRIEELVNKVEALKKAGAL